MVVIDGKSDWCEVFDAASDFFDLRRVSKAGSKNDIDALDSITEQSLPKAYVDFLGWFGGKPLFQALDRVGHDGGWHGFNTSLECVLARYQAGPPVSWVNRSTYSPNSLSRLIIGVGPQTMISDQGYENEPALISSLLIYDKSELVTVSPYELLFNHPKELPHFDYLSSDLKAFVFEQAWQYGHLAGCSSIIHLQPTNGVVHAETLIERVGFERMDFETFDRAFYRFGSEADLCVHKSQRTCGYRYSTADGKCFSIGNGPRISLRAYSPKLAQRLGAKLHQYLPGALSGMGLGNAQTIGF